MEDKIFIIEINLSFGNRFIPLVGTVALIFFLRNLHLKTNQRVRNLHQHRKKN